MIPLDQYRRLLGGLSDHETQQVRMTWVGNQHAIASPAQRHGFIEKMPGLQMPIALYDTSDQLFSNL